MIKYIFTTTKCLHDLGLKKKLRHARLLQKCQNEDVLWCQSNGNWNTAFLALKEKHYMERKTPLNRNNSWNPL